ncbi:hypothetical protein ACQP1S_20315 [Micromonospora matsumotoense]
MVASDSSGCGSGSALLGGRFTAGRTDGGWQVTADLPLHRAEP